MTLEEQIKEKIEYLKDRMEDEDVFGFPMAEMRQHVEFLEKLYDALHYE